ncbi:hypothetical protein ACP46_gp77 [Rhizobium phage RHEph06]|uniref:Uncharacterized protein n=2 Tax=Kleczkowskavirus RHEph4 TaxID=1921526 RepID=L7TMJ5_9CAUD|nr:hypothetical protein ACP46_gp77 [Rhizobium phage RHEph06]YP_009598518.1 hypothetical protein FDH25_gp76 [Rhizobium phage RHEph04]AGC35838.1 hypothetical protein RHEph05_gp071 [Rhizobium phage RHEph05]QXV74870.1 hypothetical protein [Rhizobium phage RHEph26]AGC35762.1 hypothetical protein RHEph04_gp076 [Rhizobium phage RHEph04]AGC35919.1 hypothetical protein RHEph06_gp077 [Rhizobium phage RHEph06]
MIGHIKHVYFHIYFPPLNTLKSLMKSGLELYVEEKGVKHESKSSKIRAFWHMRTFIFITPCVPPRYRPHINNQTYINILILLYIFILNYMWKYMWNIMGNRVESCGKGFEV